MNRILASLFYDVDGEQFDPGNAEFEFVRDCGEIDPEDSDTFWEALTRDGVDVRVP